jgi:uncharacterized protein DUF481
MEWDGRALAISSIVVGLLLSTVTAMAQSPPQVFQPTPPAPDTFDWIQLTSDQWLKGEPIALYDGRLEFDSEELENLTFDCDDIRELRTGRVVQVRFKNRTQLTGRLLVDAKTVRVLGDTEQQFDRAELLSITPGEPRESSYWSGNVNVGFTLRSGNSDQVEANTVASARRRTVTTRVVLDYVGHYNLTDDIAVTNNQRVTGAMDWFVTSRFFVRPVVAEVLPRSISELCPSVDPVKRFRLHQIMTSCASTSYPPSRDSNLHRARGRIAS